MIKLPIYDINKSTGERNTQLGWHITLSGFPTAESRMHESPSCRKGTSPCYKLVNFLAYVRQRNLLFFQYQNNVMFKLFFYVLFIFSRHQGFVGFPDQSFQCKTIKEKSKMVSKMLSYEKVREVKHVLFTFYFSRVHPQKLIYEIYFKNKQKDSPPIRNRIFTTQDKIEGVRKVKHYLPCQGLCQARSRNLISQLSSELSYIFIDEET